MSSKGRNVVSIDGREDDPRFRVLESVEEFAFVRDEAWQVLLGLVLLDSVVMVVVRSHCRAKMITLLTSHPQLESHALKEKKVVSRRWFVETLKSSGLEKSNLEC